MFLIGEFSKISQVSKRLLHYYDDIGLLKPAYIDQFTNYRYYSAEQLPRLNRILALKDLGLTLDQIKKMLQADLSDDEINGMLLIKKAEMEQVVLEDYQRLRHIEARLQQNQLAEAMPDVVIKSIPAQSYLSVRTTFKSAEELLQLVDQLFHVLPDKVGQGVLGSFAGVFYTDSYTEINNDVDLGYFLKKKVANPIPLTEELVLHTQELPPVKTMATLVQVGNPDLEFISLGKIAHWVEGNGYRIVGPYREIGFDVLSLSDLEKAVIEIQIPVEKTTRSAGLKLNISELTK